MVAPAGLPSLVIYGVSGWLVCKSYTGVVTGGADSAGVAALSAVSAAVLAVSAEVSADADLAAGAASSVETEASAAETACASAPVCSVRDGADGSAAGWLA